MATMRELDLSLPAPTIPSAIVVLCLKPIEPAQAVMRRALAVRLQESVVELLEAATASRRALTFLWKQPTSCVHFARRQTSGPVGLPCGAPSAGRKTIAHDMGSTATTGTRPPACARKRRTSPDGPSARAAKRSKAGASTR